MLDFRQVGAQLDDYRRRLTRRAGFDAALLDRVKSLWEDRAIAIHEAQKAQEERNRLNDSMKSIMKSGTPEEKDKARAAGKAISDRVKSLEVKLKEVEASLETLMLDIPNAPSDSVPDGASSEQNVVVRTWGAKPDFAFQPRQHDEIGVDKLRLLDFERAGKLSGSRFVVEYGDAAQLERALASFMLDTHTREHGYTEVAVPFLVNRATMTGTGQLPKFEADLFKVAALDGSDLFLIPTAEVPVTNLYADSIIGPDDGSLPHAYCCATACFRSEAGAAGKDTRGMIRQHQFSKVELVRFVEPETSYDQLEQLVAHAEAILQKLGLHYRVVMLCAGDLGANAAKCYDLEVWLPGQGQYREISSCSNFEDFQARRAKIRFKSEAQGKAKLVHTLNGSGLAVGRTLIAIFEQYQDADGGVRIPEALRPYMGGKSRIEPKPKKA
ncbi:MAG: serine--tRNA ligase [Deltaproteobacteria bacterium]|nr:serine--tRNA ligase [Deltaproteobacteria bacterium]